jgi:hypothetical protein
MRPRKVVLDLVTDKKTETHCLDLLLPSMKPDCHHLIHRPLPSGNRSSSRTPRKGGGLP